MRQILQLSVLLLLFQANFAIAQDSQPDFGPYIDSVLQSSKDVTKEFSERIQIAEGLIEIAEAKNDTALLVESTYSVVMAQHDNAKYLESIDNLEFLMTIIRDKKSENYAYVMNKYGLSYYRLGFVNHSLEKFEIAKKTFHELGNKNQELGCLNNIANIHLFNENHELALSYFDEIFEIAKRNGLEMGSKLTNRARAYNIAGYSDTAYFMLKDAVEYSKVQNDIESEVFALTTLGEFLYKNEEADLAQEYYDQALTKNSLIRPRSAVKLFTSYGIFLFNEGKYKLAKEALLEADKRSKGNDDFKQIMWIQKFLGEIAYKEGDYSTFKKMNDEGNSLQDSLQKARVRMEFDVYQKVKELNERNVTLLEQRNQLELENKENKLEIAESQRDKYVLLFWLVITTFIVLGFIFILRERLKRTKQKSKALKTKNEKLESTLSVKEDQLTDIAIFLSQNKEILRGIKKKLSNLKSSQNLDKDLLDELIVKISDVLYIDKDLNQFYELIEDVNNSFISNLMGKYPNLTKNEVRLISLLKLNLSSKEIAVLINISPKSVNVSRHRLRKKLNMSRDESLKSLFNDF